MALKTLLRTLAGGYQTYVFEGRQSSVALTMTRTASSLDVQIIRALPEQEAVLANMLELYAHDFSELIDLKLGADGRFGYKQLPLYWTESDRYPFIIMANGNLAGFVFVRRGSQISVWDMAEFFIVRGFRGLGLGGKVAQRIWQQFPGKWEARVMDRNQKAKEFWWRAINQFLDEPIEPIPFDKDGEGWHVFSFESKRAA